jgi:glycine/D-amino acid oxidase-like deaminating enzyme
MHIAIIGGGFAGLGLAYFLTESKRVRVTIFEALSPGAGASGAACGLLHPYPGLGARRSKLASEALAVTKQLLRFAEGFTPKIISCQTGILRQSVNTEQQATLTSHAQEWGDVEQLEHNLFLIHSGITVHSKNYIEGLSQGLKMRGVAWEYQKIEDLQQLDSFDGIVIAAGYGVRSFPKCNALKVKFLKGQALSLAGDAPIEKSLISKGYIAHLENGATFEVGATYERTFLDDKPDLETAKGLLAEPLGKCRESEILACKAGVRVCPLEHYLPITEKVAENVYVFTGLGSRGLLYHGYFGRALCQAILSKNRVLG